MWPILYVAYNIDHKLQTASFTQEACTGTLKRTDETVHNIGKESEKGKLLEMHPCQFPVIFCMSSVVWNNYQTELFITILLVSIVICISILLVPIPEYLWTLHTVH